MTRVRTKQAFGGARAAIGNAVIVKYFGRLVLGMIVSIEEEKDQPLIWIVGTLIPTSILTFNRTISEEDTENIDELCWAWRNPPKIKPPKLRLVK